MIIVQYWKVGRNDMQKTIIYERHIGRLDKQTTEKIAK